MSVNMLSNCIKNDSWSGHETKARSTETQHRCNMSLESMELQSSWSNNKPARKSIVDEILEVNQYIIESERPRLERLHSKFAKSLAQARKPPAFSRTDYSSFDDDSDDEIIEDPQPTSQRYKFSPDMIRTIEYASDPNPPRQLLVEIDGVQIFRKDMTTLTDNHWLNDEVVKGYMNLLVMRGGTGNSMKVYALSTFFYPKIRDSGYSSVKRWTRKVDIFSFNLILVPIHLGDHWCLAAIDFTERTITYYDSLGGRNYGCCEKLLCFLYEESLDKKGKDFDDENWKIIDTYQKPIPRQQNGYDCGVFACTYAEHLTRQAGFSFNQKDMPYLRKKMIYELMTKQILV